MPCEDEVVSRVHLDLGVGAEVGGKGDPQGHQHHSGMAELTTPEARVGSDNSEERLGTALPGFRPPSDLLEENPSGAPEHEDPEHHGQYHPTIPSHHGGSE